MKLQQFIWTTPSYLLEKFVCDVYLNEIFHFISTYFFIKARSDT